MHSVVVRCTPSWCQWLQNWKYRDFSAVINLFRKCLQGRTGREGGKRPPNLCGCRPCAFVYSGSQCDTTPKASSTDKPFRVRGSGCVHVSVSECTSDSGVPYRSNHPCRRLHLALLLSLIRLRAVVYRSTYGNRPCQGASLSSAPTAISLPLSMTGSKVVKRRRVCKDINYRETSCFVSCSRRRC